MNSLRITLKLISIVILVLLFTACSTDIRQQSNIIDDTSEQLLTSIPIETTIPQTITDDEASSQYHEAPMLAQHVANGELPPIQKRIPKNPRVIPVYEEIGQYGGTWRRAYTGLGDRFGPTKLIEERIIEFYMLDDALSIELNWADQFEANDDSTEYTVHIREGLRWSDGVEVTTEDVRFWYEDVLMSETFFPTFPIQLIVNDQPVIVDIIDKYTFIIKFAAPYPLFPNLVARSTPGAMGLQGTSFILPSHYLKNYHPTYTTSDELEKVVADYGVDSWIDLWGDGPVQSWWLNPDLPVLAAWKITVPPPANTMIMERNPYYHAVDAEGNQLPYIDTIVHELVNEPETISLWAIQGLIDLQARHIGPSNLDLYTRNQTQGNYHIVTWRGGSTEALNINLNTPDPILANLFEDRRFRQALSISINRSEVLAVQFNDFGEIRQASPVTGSPQFDAEFEQRWTQYDPDTANVLLDDIGLTEYDENGFRLRPDGETLTLTISSTGSEILLGFIQDYWADIGIKASLELMSRLDYEQHAQTGDLEIGYWDFDRNVVIASDPGRYLGTISDGPWAPLYGEWYRTDGEAGIEPPVDHPIRKVWEAWDNAKSAPTLKIANDYIQEMVTIHKENIWVIGLIGERPIIYIVSNNMHNFPDDLIHETSLRDIGLALPIQFFFKE